MYLKVLVLNSLEWKKGDVFLVMSKLNEFKQDNGKLIVTTGKCLVCGDELLVFGTDTIYICPKCKEILNAGNCLVLETMFVEDDRIVTARNCIVPKEQMHTNVPIVCMPSDEFSKLYEIYKTKAN
mgnify:FL=1|jgi:predicted RNA-binding Zn-ribbon protein involved in translation (DUF1610 family)